MFLLTGSEEQNEKPEFPARAPQHKLTLSIPGDYCVVAPLSQRGLQGSEKLLEKSVLSGGRDVKDESIRIASIPACAFLFTDLMLSEAVSIF